MRNLPGNTLPHRVTGVSCRHFRVFIEGITLPPVRTPKAHRLKAKAEGKHRFFDWLFLQEKIQTADNLLLKGIECDPVCCLCDQDFETAVHLCLQCCFAQEIWVLVRAWTEGLINVPLPGVQVEEWWNSSL